MDRLIFTSMASINERRLLRDQLYNELANMSTVGFKRSFDSALTAVKAEGDGFDTRIQPFIQQKDAVSMAPGALMATGRNLDIAINEKGVLGVLSKEGQLGFTRRGDLRVNSQGVLENGSGYLVLGQAGNPITIPAGFDVNITKEGEIYARDMAQPGVVPAVLIDKLMLRDSSQMVFERRDDSLMTPQAEYRQENGDFKNGPLPVTVTPQALESSNVNPVLGMVKLLDFSRSFESQMRFIKEARSLDESGATMMKTR